MLRARGEESRLPHCYEAGEAGKANWSGTALGEPPWASLSKNRGVKQGPSIRQPLIQAHLAPASPPRQYLPDYLTSPAC